MTMLPLTASFNSMWAGNPLLLSPEKISVFRSWQTASFTGNTQADSIERGVIIRSVRHMMTNSIHDGGVRIYFTSTSHYKDLVFAFDLMSRENVRQYWLDVKHRPTALYAFTKKYRPEKYSHFDCLLCNDVISYAPPRIPVSLWVCFDDWVTDFWHLTWLRPLLQPEWRVSMWLLAAIVVLGGWRIIGPRRATQVL